MKNHPFRIRLTGCGALAATALLANCYYKPTEVHQNEPGTSSTVTTYSPGYVVQTLPSGSQTRTIRGSTYYFYNGSYFQPTTSGYVVVESP